MAGITRHLRKNALAALRWIFRRPQPATPQIVVGDPRAVKYWADQIAKETMKPSPVLEHLLKQRE